MVARPLVLLAVCMMLSIGWAGCTEPDRTEFRTELEIDIPPEPLPDTYVLTTGGSMNVDRPLRSSADPPLPEHRAHAGHNGTHREPLERAADQRIRHDAGPGDGATVRECIAWHGAGPPFFPEVVRHEDAPPIEQWPDRACGPTDAAPGTEARSTDFAAVMGEGVPLHWFDGTVIDHVSQGFVAVVEHGDCDPMTGSSFKILADHIVASDDGIEYRTRHLTYECHGAKPDAPRGATPEEARQSITEHLFLTKMVDVTDAQATAGLPAWLVVVDTCDNVRLGDADMDSSRIPCTDGRPVVFDDTVRGSFLHDGTDARGASHRETCRDPSLAWAPWPTRDDGDGCSAEAHGTALVDVWYYEGDPSGGLWATDHTAAPQDA